MNRNTYTDESIRVAALPHKELPPCDLCEWYIILISDAMLRWRCARCLRYAHVTMNRAQQRAPQASLF